VIKLHPYKASRITQIPSSVQAASDKRLLSYWIVASSVIAIYDTMLTFPQEVRFVWMGKLRAMTVLYVTARLSILLYQNLFTIILLTPLGEKWGIPLYRCETNDGSCCFC